jgi:hypothetical protein
MPTLKDYRDNYEEFSGTASEVSRKLGFAAIAVIWIFKDDVVAGKSYALAPDLYSAGIAVVLSLGFDLFQYVFNSLIWDAYWRLKEKAGVKENAKIDAPAFFNWPALFFFWTKLTLMVVAYSYLLLFLVQHVSAKP